MTRLLASVRNLSEARLALNGGADVIDIKEPNSGALGAVPRTRLNEIAEALRDKTTLSATIGDPPMRPTELSRAVAATAASGVHYIKVGLFPDDDHIACLEALASAPTRGAGMVAVLFADREPDFGLLEAIQGAGLQGAMLDTATKGMGLRNHLGTQQLARFVAQCRKLGLFCGLAGSLTPVDIEPLLRLSPDYLGFRGALCGGDRKAQIDPAAVAAIRDCIPIQTPGLRASL